MDGRFRAQVFGMVQGVGFRFFVVRQARALGLAGYVRNLADGTVEVVAEGTAEKLNLLLDQLRAGPAGAEVATVNAIWDGPSGRFHSFDIEH